MESIGTAVIGGFLLGASLIVVIGAQNAFVLRQGLLRQHVFVLCIICALSDAVLIAVGVAGFGTVVRQVEWLLFSVTLGGALFLGAFGFTAFRRAVNPQTLHAAEGGAVSLRAAVLTCLALTFLNPHVYFDTLILLGGISANYDERYRVAFGAGAASASFAWFFTLGYGARLLSEIFEKPVAWRILDTIIGMIMWVLAGSLVYELHVT